MQIDPWSKVELLVQAALQLEPARRSDFVRDACGSDSALKTEVEFLLVARERAMGMPETSTLPVAEGHKHAAWNTAEIFKGRFIFDRCLGSGGFGAVYAAQDRARGVRVAVKLLHRTDPSALYRFKQEFRALSDLSHPNLVKIYELLSEGDHWLFTMELLDGVDFLSYVRASPQQFDVTRLRLAGVQLAEGLHALHNFGKLHRDLKPSNVHVTSQDRVVILDFGLVSETGEGEPETIAGTPGYVAPEQARGGAVTAASDWYSFGVMLYEALTSRRPKRGTSVVPSAVVSGVPADLDQLVPALLRFDPTARPTGKEVLSRLRDHRLHDKSYGSGTGAGRSVFVGREANLAELHAAFNAAKDRPQVVLVHGNSGIGKTSLVSQFVSEARRSGAIVLSGRCYVRESVPFKGIDGVVDALAQYLKRLSELEAGRLMPRDIAALAQLFPVLRQVASVIHAPRKLENVIDVQERRRRAFTALKELFARIADERPLILWIDDLHWGDVDSLLPLSDIIRPPDAPALLLIACYRSDEAATSSLLSGLLPVLADLRPAIELRQIVLAELSREEARALANELVIERSPDPAALADSVARESGGNPYWITELSRHERLMGRPYTRLEEAVLERVSALPDDARRLLEVTAVAGEPLDLMIASRSAGLADNDPGLLAVLSNAHFVRQRSTGELETYHDRVRETVIASLGSAAVREWHRRLASAMEADGNTRDKETLARHFYEGGDLRRAASYAAEAADAAAHALAFDRAVRLYRLALECKAMDSGAARQLSIRMADALSNAGRGEEAAQTYLSAAEGADVVETLELRRRAAGQLLLSGRVDVGISVLKDVLGSVGMRFPTTTYGALVSGALYQAWLFMRGVGFRSKRPGPVALKDLLRVDACGTLAMGLAGVDPIRGFSFAVRHLLLALKAGEPSRISRALATEATYESFRGASVRRRVEFLLRESHTLAEETADPTDRAVATMMTGVVHFLRGEWKQNRELVPAWEEWNARAKATSLIGLSGWEYTTTKFTSYVTLHLLGDFQELGRLVPFVLRDARERGDQYTIVSVRNRLLPFVHLAADEAEQARRELAQAIGDWSVQGFHLQHYFHAYAHGEVDLYSGNSRAAWKRMLAIWGNLRKAFLTSFEVVLIEALHFQARAAISLAAEGVSVKKSLRAAERQARAIERRRSPWGDGLALLIRAGAASVRGDMVKAEDLLAMAEVALERAGMLHYLAAAHWNRSRILTDSRSMALRQAAESYFETHQIKNPGRMTAALVPGRWA